MARPDNPVQRLLRWIGGHRHVALSLILLASLLGVAAVAWSLHQRRIDNQEAHRRETALGSFLTVVSRRAARIDRHFLEFEALLLELSSAAETALTRGQASQLALYSDDDYADPARQPPDVTLSSHYKKNISLDWPVYKLAPGVKRETVLPALRRLAHLGPRMRRISLLAFDERAPSLPAKEQRRILLETGSPMIWCYVGLQSGVHFAYPGKAGYPADYDPRERPWYKLSASKPTLQWGNSYPDVGGQGLILPCTKAIHDGDRLLGVVGVEMTFNYLSRQLLKLPLKGVTETFLLDDQARIVARSSDPGRTYEGGKLYRNKAVELEPFHLKEVVEAIRTKPAGLEDVRVKGQWMLVAYHRLESVGWYYVVVAEHALVLGK